MVKIKSGTSKNINNQSDVSLQTSPSVNDGQLQRLLSEAAKLHKQGTFNLELINKVDELWECLRQYKEENQDFYKAKAIVSEVRYHFGDIAGAVNAVPEGLRLFAELEREDVSPASPIEQRRLVREKIRCYQAYAQATDYRNLQYEKIKGDLEYCRTLIKDKLVNDDMACYGTLAQTSYHLGRINRQMNFYDEAEEAFTEAIEYYLRRGELKKREYEVAQDGKDHLSSEFAFLNHKVAICLGLGLGWVDYTRSRLADAYRKVITAKLALADSQDELNKSYLDLMRGSILRCQAGKDQTKLEEAMSYIKDAQKVFSDLEHARYLPRATYELALAHLEMARLLSDSDGYEDYINNAALEAQEVEKSAASLKDWRWSSNALVVQSRIESERKNFGRAKELATRALQQADKYRQIVCLIDARIARAEAELRAIRHEGGALNKSRLKAVRADLREARRLNKRLDFVRTHESQNVKIEGRCWLYEAQSYAMEGSQQQAEEYYKRWENLTGIEHQGVLDLAAGVKSEIDSLRTKFIIDSTVDDLDYEKNMMELQKFLVNAAEQKSQKQTSQAKILGISRQTFLNWRTSWNSKKMK